MMRTMCYTFPHDLIGVRFSFAESKRFSRVVHSSRAVSRLQRSGLGAREEFSQSVYGSGLAFNFEQRLKCLRSIVIVVPFEPSTCQYLKG